MFLSKYCLPAALLLLLVPLTAFAGMPALLPTEVEQVLRLNDSVQVRLQAISFFLVVLLLSAAAVRLLWNYLQRDFPHLPRLSYFGALGGVVLWGLLFIVVLAMISGARELMTPGAWRKEGFTYKLASDGEADGGLRKLRERHLERLRTALLQFAATHNGRFPSASETADIPAELWAVPDGGGLRYLYVAERTAGSSPALLAYEPELDTEDRLALQTNGDIVRLSTADVNARRQKESRP